jgi:gamma-glutamyltranspeptidase / glutathione hydrolase
MTPSVTPRDHLNPNPAALMESIRSPIVSKRTLACISCLLIVVYPILLSSGGYSGQARYPQEPVLIEPGLQELASSPVSMVTTAHPFATGAGLEMLRRGGNAIDAAVAAAMVLAVVDTGLTSFAGGGELTFYEATTKKTITLDFDPNAVEADVLPYDRARDETSGRAIRVPGSIAGFYSAIHEYGSLPWKEVLEPAIFYAENGFPINGQAYSTMQQRYDALTLRPSGRRIFAPNGFLPPVGSIFKQPEMADTLKSIAQEGPEFFYKGSFAEEMVKAIQGIGGKATLQDFASYQVLNREPIRGTYQDYSIVGPPPPGTGTVSIIEGMNILENVDLKSMGHYSQSADALQWAIETLRVILDDSRKYSGIPELDLPLAQALISKEYARAQFNAIHHRIEVTRRQATENHLETQPFRSEGEAEGAKEGGTHQISAVDKAGNICSITHTIWGAIYSAHGLFVGGIVMNSAAFGTAQPGGRMVGPLAPVIVFKGDQPFFATGSSGGTTNTFITALNVLAWNQNFKEAQEAPRFRLNPGNWSGPPIDGSTVFIEHRLDDQVAEQLRRRGYRIGWVGPYSQFGAQIAGIDPGSGRRYGATDPRLAGKAAGQ